MNYYDDILQIHHMYLKLIWRINILRTLEIGVLK